jgi:hypothetical protein
MNNATSDQTPEATPIVVYQNPAPAVKCCISCKQELLVNENIHYTNFGLDLCEDCLYT